MHGGIKRARGSVGRIGVGSALILAGMGVATVSASADELPAGYAYELVSPLQTAGQRVKVISPSDGEDQTFVSSPGGFPGTENLPKLGAWARSRRTATGWTSTALDPPAADVPFLGITGLFDWSRDMSRTLWNANLKADRGTQRFTPIVREADGSVAIAGPTQDQVALIALVGASADLGTVVTMSEDRPALTDGTTDTRAAGQKSLLVSRRGPDGSLDVRQVAFRGGATMSPSCNLQLGGTSITTSRGSVSEDGTKIFFTTVTGLTCSNGINQRVWAKVGDQDPVDLSMTRCTVACGAAQRVLFEGAARDGSRVFFSTAEKLLDDDLDATEKTDLYEYDFNAPGGGKLLPVTASPAANGAGVVRLVRLSEDGSRAYFVANGRPLTGPNARGLTPVAGAQNLYVYHRESGQASGTFKFIAPLDNPADLYLWSGDDGHRFIQLSPTGRFAIFQSAGDLTGDRLAGDTRNDTFRYDAQTEELERIWSDDPAHNGAARTADSYLPASVGDAFHGGFQSEWDKGRFMSDDGSKILLQTREPLSPDDSNDQVDVYLWQKEAARITMLTDGQAEGAATAGGMSRSGDSMFFSTSSPLLRGHTSGSVAGYVLRKGGGFEDPPLPSLPCSGDGCQGASVAAPGPLALTGSSVFSGGGDLAAREPTPQAENVRVGQVRTVGRTSARISVRAPGKGRIRVSGPGLSGVSKAASKAGTYGVAIRLSKRSRATLNRRHRLRVRVHVRFMPSSGKPSSVRVPVTFTAKSSGPSLRSSRDAQVLSSDSRKER